MAALRRTPPPGSPPKDCGHDGMRLSAVGLRAATRSELPAPRITRRPREVGKIMGVRVLDHIIIGKGRYVSFDDGYW